MKRLKIKCDNCQAIVINGIACHETGCPSEKRPWVEISGYLIPGDLFHETYNDDEIEEYLE